MRYAEQSVANILCSDAAYAMPRLAMMDPAASFDVAIVGAGITGLSTAFQLAQTGDCSVVVLERSGIGAEASGVQPGGVRQQWSKRVSCLLARESRGFYQEIGDRLQSTVRPVLEPCGYMFLAHSRQRLKQLAADVKVQRGVGVPSEILGPVEAAERVPDLQTETVVGAAWCQEDGYFDRPQAVVAAFAEAAQRMGATIDIAEVAALTPDSGGWRLSLSDGRTVHAESTIVAAGYDVPSLLEPLGIDLPIVKEPRYIFLSEPIRERLLDPLVISGEHSFAAKQLADGRVLTSHTAANGEPSEEAGAWRQTIRSNIEVLLPRLQYVSFPILVEGFYDVTPDLQPIVAEVGERLWVAAGFSGHGFMLAPAIGRRLAAAVRGERVDEFLDWFVPDRFHSPSVISESDWIV